MSLFLSTFTTFTQKSFNVLIYYFQGLLSTTFLVDIFFRTKETENEEEEEKKSVFVKIPLTGEAGKNFKQVIN